MPSLNLSEDQISHVICLPGTALIRCLKPETETKSGLVIPDAAASWDQENRAIREGVIERIDHAKKGSGLLNRMDKEVEMGNNYDQSMKVGAHVYYLGRQDEASDVYVVVKIGQIVAVKEPKK